MPEPDLQEGDDVVKLVGVQLTDGGSAVLVGDLSEMDGPVTLIATVTEFWAGRPAGPADATRYTELLSGGLQGEVKWPTTTDEPTWLTIDALHGGKSDIVAITQAGNDLHDQHRGTPRRGRLRL